MFLHGSHNMTLTLDFLLVNQFSFRDRRFYGMNFGNDNGVWFGDRRRHPCDNEFNLSI